MGAKSMNKCRENDKGGGELRKDLTLGPTEASEDIRTHTLPSYTRQMKKSIKPTKETCLSPRVWNRNFNKINIQSCNIPRKIRKIGERDGGGVVWRKVENRPKVDRGLEYSILIETRRL